VAKRIRKQQSTQVAAFSRRLKELRSTRGLSQIALAKKAEINLSYLNRLERGDATPGLDLICKLAGGLGVSPVEFFAPAQPLDPIQPLRQQVRQHFDAVLQKADRSTLEMLAQMHSLLNSALARTR